MIKEKGARILLKYITSYLVIVFIFCLLIFVLYSTNYNTGKSVTDAYIISAMDHGLKKLEETVVQLNAIFSHVNSDSNFIYLLNQKSPLPYQSRAQIIWAQSSFSALNNINTVVDRLILTLPNGLVFCSDGTVHESVELFYNDFLYYDSMSAAEWLNKVNTVFQFWESMPVTGRNLRNDEYLTYNCRNTNVGMHMMALISKKELLDLFYLKEDEKKFGIQVKYGDKVLIDTIEIIGKPSDYSRIERSSEQISFTVSVLVPSRYYADSILPLTDTLWRIILFVLVIGIMLSIIFGLQHSKSIRNLAVFLSKRGELQAINPADSAQKLLAKMDETLHDSVQKTDELSKALTDIKFQLRIMTDSPNIKDDIQINVDNSEHVLVIINFSEELPDSINSIFGKLFNDKHFYRIGSGNYVLLYPWADGSRSELEALSSDVSELIALNKTKWAVSREFKSITELKFAYLEAEFTLSRGDYSLSTINYFSDLDLCISNPLLSPSHYNQLDSYLAGDKPDKINLFFSQLQYDILNASLTSKEIKQIAYILRSLLIKRNTKQSDFTKIFHIPHLNSDPPEMECLTVIREICLSIVEDNQYFKHSHNDKLRDEIIEILSDEYYNYDLSLTWIADKLGSTPKYISNFISEQLGKSYTDLIQEIRMSHAGRLFEATDLSVNQVAARVGYMSPNAFYKGFKRYYGLSPSEYKTAKTNHLNKR